MAITFKQVNYLYNEDTPFSFHALKDINLSIKDGSFVAFIGHTGSGKSTLIQHLNALIKPTSGQVIIDEMIVDRENKKKQLKALRKKSGLVFQFPEYQLFEETIEKDIMFGPMNFGVSEEEAKAIAKEMIVKVGLDESYLPRSPFELSGGQKRRIAIAGILALKPDILVLDEPTSGLDPLGMKQMMDLFKKLNDEGHTIIMVTHDMNHVLNYCDYAYILNKGRIEKEGTPTELFKQADYLSQLSIELPTITSFIHLLNKQGFHIDPSIKTIEALTQAIKGGNHE